MALLVVGNACVDVIDAMSEFPVEDQEYRTKTRVVRVGGNGANMARVAAQVPGVSCSLLYAAVPEANDPNSVLINKALKDASIGNLGAFTGPEGCRVPLSFIIQCPGTRTILHHRDLREMSLADFQRVFTPHYDWVHFEGRNTSETLKMMQFLKQFGTSISLEVEMERDPPCDPLYEEADIVVFARCFVQGRGFKGPREFIKTVRPRVQTAVITWGDEGAYYFSPDVEFGHVPAKRVESLVDTVGAGDTFIGVLVGQLMLKVPLIEAVRLACEKASKKCSQQGLLDLF